MAKVSVIIPTYNCASYLPEAIDSVLSQNYKDLEIIVIDDGSTDHTKEVILPYLKSSNLITYISQINQGPGAARNKGIHIAKGDFICFLDADDLLLQQSISEKLNLIEKFRDIGLVFSDYFLDSAKNVSVSRLSSKKFLHYFRKTVHHKENDAYIFDENFYKRYITFSIWPIWTGTVMIQKRVVENIGLFRTDTFHAEDADYWLRIVRNYRIGFINKPLSVYKRSRSVLTMDFENNFLNVINSRLDVLNYELTNKNHYSRIINKLKSKISKEYTEFGRLYLRNFKTNKSRIMLFTALKFKKLSFTTYLFIFVSFLPVSLQRFLRILKSNLNSK